MFSSKEEIVLLRMIFCEYSKGLKDFSWYMWKIQNLIKKKIKSQTYLRII